MKNFLRAFAKQAKGSAHNVTDFAEISSPVSAGTGDLADIPNMVVTLTLTRPVPVFVSATFEAETISGASATVLGVAINTNGTNHQEHQVYLSGANDKHICTITHRSENLPVGEISITLRMHRVSGVATPGMNNATLFAMALQGTI